MNPFTEEKVPLAMHRIYIKDRGKWRAIGWVCLNCGRVDFDVRFPIREYFTVERIHEDGIPLGYQAHETDIRSMEEVKAITGNYQDNAEVPHLCKVCDAKDIEEIKNCQIKRTRFIIRPCPRERALTS